MHTLTLDTTDFLIPENWNEFTREQLMFMANIFLNKPGIDIQEFKIKLFLQILEANLYQKLRKPETKYYVLVAKKKKFPLSIEDFTSCVDLLDFIFTAPDKNGNKYLNPTLTINHFKTTQCGCKHVYGPDDAFTNMDYDQFMMLQVYQMELNTEKGMNEFMACMFARKKYQPELENIGINADFFAKLSPTVKIITLWYFHGCMSFLKTKFSRVFVEGDGEVITNIFDQQMKLLNMIAKGDPTKYKEVEETALYKVLYSMQETFEEAARLESEHPELFKK